MWYYLYIYVYLFLIRKLYDGQTGPIAAHPLDGTEMWAPIGKRIRDVDIWDKRSFRGGAQAICDAAWLQIA